jgi:hypothetical protein
MKYISAAVLASLFVASSASYAATANNDAVTVPAEFTAGASSALSATWTPASSVPTGQISDDTTKVGTLTVSGVDSHAGFVVTSTGSTTAGGLAYMKFTGEDGSSLLTNFARVAGQVESGNEGDVWFWTSKGASSSQDLYVSRSQTVNATKYTTTLTVRTFD